MRRKNVPCSPCSGGTSSGDCCGLKEKLRILWDRTIGSILRINGISPDGDGDFTIEAGTNISITERGTGNGLRIDTTGGVSYYTTDDPLLDIDNTNLKISTVDVATDTDLQLVAGAVSDILDGTSTVPNATDAVNATNAQYLGSSSANEGNNTKPIIIVNGIATAVTNDLVSCGNVNQTIIGDKTINHLFFKRPSDNNMGYGYIENQYTTNINQTIIEVNNDNASSRGRLYLRFNKTNNTVTLELQKNLNGTVTWSTIGTL